MLKVFSWEEYALLENEEQPDSAGGIFVCSVFMTRRGNNGMLYREGEFCIVINTQGEQVVLRLFL